ncbi:hypothetical protein [Paenibacillus sp. GCM10027626]
MHFLTPSHFFDHSRWTDRYVLKPLAIGQPELVYRRERTNDEGSH